MGLEKLAFLLHQTQEKSEFFGNFDAQYLFWCACVRVRVRVRA